MKGIKKEAEELYIEANKELQKADRKMSGVHLADIAIIRNNLAVLLSCDKSRRTESIMLLEGARKAMEKCEEDAPNLYLAEIAAIINNLAVVNVLRGNNITQAEELFCDAIKMNGTLEDTQFSMNRTGLLETRYNLGLLLCLKGDYQSAVKKFRSVFHDLSHNESNLLMGSENLKVFLGLLGIKENDEPYPEGKEDITIDNTIDNVRKALPDSKFIMYTLSGSRIARMMLSAKLHSMS